MLGELGLWPRHAISSTSGATARTVWRAASTIGRTAEGTAARGSDAEDLATRAFTQPRVASTACGRAGLTRAHAEQSGQTHFDRAPTEGLFEARRDPLGESRERRFAHLLAKQHYGCAAAREGTPHLGGGGDRR